MSTQPTPSDEEHDLTPEPLDVAAEGRPEIETTAVNEEGEELPSREEEIERQARETYERLLRVSAELDNYKKRTAREKAEFMRYANEKLARDLLESVDNLERALAHHKESATADSDEALATGVEMTLKLLLDTLKRHGVVPIEAVGAPFDPNLHEAVGESDSDAVEPGHVAEEYQRGYLLHDRLLRPAMVVVRRK